MSNELMGAGTSLSLSPTDRFPNLTEAGRQLLEVMIDPVNRTLPVTKICEKANISRDSFYRLWKNEAFKIAYQELCQTTCLSQALAAINALGVQASLGDPACIKMVLEMAGMYQPKATLNVNHTIEAPTLKEILKARANKKLKGSVK